MSKTVKIPVPGGLLGHGTVYMEVVLKEPAYADYMRIGEVVSFIGLPSGEYIRSELQPNIDAYIAVCLVSPKDPLILEQGGFKLARAVKRAVLSFFQDESEEAEPSGTSNTSSSGKPNQDDSAPTTSSA